MNFVDGASDEWVIGCWPCVDREISAERMVWDDPGRPHARILIEAPRLDDELDGVQAERSEP